MYISDDDLKLWERDLDSIAEEFGDGIDEPPDHHTIKQREVIQRIRDKSIIDKVRNTTKYYIVTEEELDQIKNDCAFPLTFGCHDGCEYWDETGDLPCKFKGANALMDEVLTHTLEEELQKERERVLMKLVIGCKEYQDGFGRWHYLIPITGELESLRGKP